MVTLPEGVPPGAPPVRLRGRELAGPVVMAVINRTPDSFFAAARYDDGGARVAVARAADEGAAIVDLGGVRAGRGPEVTVADEVARIAPLVAYVRSSHPDLLVSVDTWRAEVARAVADEGADLLNDTWAGHDPGLVEVAAERGLGVVCSHTGGVVPRTDPFRVTYGEDVDGVLDDVVATVSSAAARAVALGVDAASVLLDPTHDFGKNTWQSLHLLRRTQALVALGHPVLMALSRKDFVGETLDLPVDERLEGTLAATAVAAWLGARVFRAHDVAATRRVLDLVASVRGERPPAGTVRGLA